jgi:hypothetical protein
MEVLVVALVEMAAEVVAVREVVGEALTLIVLQELSIILIPMAIVNQDTTLIGTQTQVVSTAQTVQTDILVTPKSSLEEMGQEDPMSLSLNILLAQSNIKKNMM